jgi:hypothetical protein
MFSSYITTHNFRTPHQAALILLPPNNSHNHPVHVVEGRKLEVGSSGWCDFWWHVVGRCMSYGKQTCTDGHNDAYVIRKSDCKMVFIKQGKVSIHTQDKNIGL